MSDSTTVLAVQLANLDQKVDAQHASVKEGMREIKESLREVEEQTRKTNGRVSSHDKRLAELRGAGVAFAAASPFLVAVLAAALSKLL